MHKKCGKHLRNEQHKGGAIAHTQNNIGREQTLKNAPATSEVFHLGHTGLLHGR